MNTFLQLVATATPYLLTAGVLAALIQAAHSELRARIDKRLTARRVLDTNLDPLLKAGDELYGKFLKLAKSDFLAPVEGLKPPSSDNLRDNLEYASFIYLIGVFWARLEILKRDFEYVELTRHKAGRRLSQFIRCLESRDFRLVSRISQRAIGEHFIDLSGSSREILPFIEISKRYRSDDEFRAWLAPLDKTLTDLPAKKTRQTVLRYGVIVHVMLDNLDPKHLITKARPGYGNKLSRGSKGYLSKRISFYLGNIREKGKYFT